MTRCDSAPTGSADRTLTALLHCHCPCHLVSATAACATDRGKFWLAALGVYDWDGLNPLTPELWILPEVLPVHPSNMWCHCRMVYLPMSYIYGLRASPPLDAVTSSLREELYVLPYDQINWNRARFEVCTHDLYSPHTWFCDRIFDALRYVAARELTRARSCLPP